MKMTLGAEPKKVIFLGGLLVVAPIVYWVNSSSTGGGESARSSPQTTVALVRQRFLITAPSDAPAAANRSARIAEREFRPSPRPKRGEARPDPTTVDPTLRLDILAKLQQVNVEGMHRSVFDFGQAPPPRRSGGCAKLPKAPSPLIGPEPPPPPQTAAVEPPKPQAPPIPLKFYGYHYEPSQ